MFRYAKFQGSFEALILIALGIGYVVLYLAKREEKRFQLLGYVIGYMIIVLSIVYLVGNLWVKTKTHCAMMRHHKGKQYKQMMEQKSRMMQPRIPKAPSQ